MTKQTKPNEAWTKIIEKYNIIEEIESKGTYQISAKDIREFREARLMSKWDSSDQLPQIFKNHEINILPNSRGTYVLGNFNLYEKLPESITKVKKIDLGFLKSLETIDIDDITSESNAINILILSGILEDFLGTDKNYLTFDGRMGSGSFNFIVENKNKSKTKIHVHNSQMEIDGGFENSESVVIMEAKNIMHDDFHIRQLYYPFRLWSQKINKPIRLVFSIYTNKIFRLLEYKFTDINDYSSIQLVKEKSYSLEETKIYYEDLVETFKSTTVKTDDKEKKGIAPFIQANKFERVISLLERIKDEPLNDEEIAEFMGFGFDENKNGTISYRQSQYYYNAGRYLGIFKKVKSEDKGVVVVLTKLGKSVYDLNYKDRQLKLVSLILEHKIFNDLFIYIMDTKEYPSKKMIQDLMRKYKVCSEKLIVRRSSSVEGWLKWIFSLLEY